MRPQEPFRMADARCTFHRFDADAFFEEKKLDILPKSQSFRIKYISFDINERNKKKYETIRWILSLSTSVCNSEMNETKRNKFRAIHKRICTTLERDNWFIRNAQSLRDTSFSFGVRSLFAANNAASQRTQHTSNTRSCNRNIYFIHLSSLFRHKNTHRKRENHIYEKRAVHVLDF